MRRLCLAVLCALLALPATASAVVGGRAATQPYPYMVALEYDPPGGQTSYSTVCGASRIAANRILTAAHCLVDDLDEDGQIDDVVPASSVRFLLGTQRLDERATAEVIQAAEITLHEKYLGGDGGYDVAIVRLSRDATKGGTIRLASPASEKPLWGPGKEAIVTGWGTAVFRDPGVTSTNQLQEIRIPMRSDDECQTSYMGTIDTATMVCAGELQGGEDSCQGDSGGPLVVPDAGGKLVQAGVVSFGNGCGFPTQYGVYARVGDSTLYDWVKQRVPAAAAPPSGGSGGSTGGGGSGGGGGGGGDTGGGTGGGTDTGGGGGAPTGPAGGGSSPGTQSGSSTYRRCMARADRARAGTPRRRAAKRCRYAQQRRVAYRRCVKRGTSPRRCSTQRRAQARRHARLVRRTR